MIHKFRESDYRMIEADNTDGFTTEMDHWLDLRYVTVGGHTLVDGVFRQAIVYRWTEE